MILRTRPSDAADAGVVGDDGQTSGAVLDQSIDQRVGLTDAAKAAKEHDRAIADARHGFGHGLHDLVDHWIGLQIRSSPRRRGPRIDMPNMMNPWIPACAGMSGMNLTRPRARAVLR